MKRLFIPLRKLQWQLSLSYIIVVMVTIPALLVVGLAVIILTPLPSPSQQLVQLLERNTAVSQVARAMQKKANIQASFSLKQFGGLNVAETLGVIIIDREGKPLAIYGNASIKELVKHRESQGTIRAAFANDPHQANLVYTFVDGQTVAAVPLLLDSKGPPIGVFFVEVRGLKNSDNVPFNPVIGFFSRMVGGGQQNATVPNETVTPNDVLPSALLLVLVISMIGIVFGVLTARRITRRLQRITSAVDAWSQGQFQTTVIDHSPDELGQLARDLNRMAQQVQTLLDTRKEFTLLEERQRVARDLHDSVKQQTFAITLLIAAAQMRLPGDPRAAQTYLVKAGDLADHTRQELTTILQQLRPAALVEKGLRAALQDYTQQWSQRSGIRAECSELSRHVVPLDIAEALFRVAQEALANVARHSQAAHVQVQLMQEQDLVCLKIHDNGKGFHVAGAMDKGQGLTNMRERVEAHQGTLSIASTTEGTLVQACIPLVISQSAGVYARATKEDNL